ncbi:MAG: glycoside hydrolase family 75 protein, partial [Rhodanobacteraceae bacterium]
KNETDLAGWHIYTPEQLETAAQVAALLINHYNLLDVIGHEDISPGRKNDPGPAFPMQSFRSRVMGRKETEPEFYLAASALNLRSGPGTENPSLLSHPLPRGTRVTPLVKAATWWKVDVEDTIDGQMDLIGWVHSGWLERADSPALPHILGTAPRINGYTPPQQSAHALEGVPFAKAISAPRADHYLASFAAADHLPKYRNDPSNCKALLQFPDGTIYYDAKMAIDADGSSRAKKIDPAGQTDTSHHFRNTAPFNAETFPYIVLPEPKPNERFTSDMGIVLGDLAVVVYKDTIATAIFADFGPLARIGEGSIHLHQMLPVHSPWRNASHEHVYDASVDGGVLVFVFPKSNIDAQLTPENALEQIKTGALERFAALKALA